MEKLEDLLEKIKRGEVNITKLAKEAGIPATRMYKWKDRDSEISLADAKKLAAWANLDLDKSLVSAPKSKDETIADLAYTNRGLTDQNKELVRMQQQLLNKYVFNSPKGGKVSLPELQEGTGSKTPYQERQLSGKRKQNDTGQE